MYAQFFKLREMPFSITPDPAYLYLSARHQEALGHLLYGTGQYGGFVQLTGEVGTGKTTVVRTLLEQNLDDVEVAMIHNPRQSEREFVRAICDELRVQYVDAASISLKDLIDSLNLHLLRNHANGKRTVVIIDEAQNLSPGVLEQVRLLTNLETHKEKLLRIMLVGQPELNELLAREELRQLASRITARYHLAPLEEAETREYVRHRLSVAGNQENLFPDDAIAEVQRYSRGIPRQINILCDRALLGAYTRHERPISPQVVRAAAAEVLGRGHSAASRDRRAGGFVGYLDRRSTGRLPRISLSVVETVVVSFALLIVGALLHQTAQQWLYPRVESSAEGQVAQRVSVSEAQSSADKAVGAPTVQSKPAAKHPTEKKSSPGRISPRISLPPGGPAAARTDPIDPKAMGRVLASKLELGELTRDLIQLWDASIRIPGSGPVCRKLKKFNLECYRTGGTLKDLRQMDRPAILSLKNADGGTVYALVTQLTEDRARIELGETAYEVSLKALSRAWSGDMLLFWRLETKQVQLAPGQRGEHIVWMRERLAQMMGQPAPARFDDRYDDDLKRQVAEFQKARGLVADGVAGIRTRIALSDPAPETPTLSYTP